MSVCGLQAAGRTGVEGPGLTRGQRTAYGALILARYLWARTSAALATRHWSVSLLSTRSHGGSRGSLPFTSWQAARQRASAVGSVHLLCAA